MIRFSLIPLAAAAAAAAAQTVPTTFDAGKAFPLAGGQWSVIASTSGPIATYGTHVELRCDRAGRTMTIARPNAGPASLTIITDSLTRALPAGGRLLASDPLLDAIAFSRGRFLVSQGGVVAAVPSGPEAARAIEDCRN